MTASRQDAWTEDDDLLLAEVTLRHIREGSTQLAAFEEVGYRLGRTPAACGFRWNSMVRKKYESAIQIAKAQRQQLKAQGKKRYIPEKAGPDRMQDSPVSEGNVLQEVSQELSADQPQGQDHQGSPQEGPQLSFEDVIRFLRQQKDRMRQFKSIEQELKKKDAEIARLKEENKEMKEELDSVQNVHEDYQALIKIMDRARKMAFLGEDDDEEKISFKMDKNGNLERVEKD